MEEYLDERIDTQKDYQIEGLWYCGTCQKPKQQYVENPILGYKKIVHCLCDCEKKELEERRARYAAEQEQMEFARLCSACNIPEKYKNASFDHYAQNEHNQKAYNVAQNYVEHFHEMKANGIGLLFFGHVGVGKTYTAACIANALLQKRVPVMMTSFTKIIENPQYDFVSAMKKAKLVILDDLGAERSTLYALEKVYYIADFLLQEKKPMVITSNLDKTDFSVDDVRYKRIYDRIMEVCKPVQISGTQSFRPENGIELREYSKLFLS